MLMYMKRWASGRLPGQACPTSNTRLDVYFFFGKYLVKENYATKYLCSSHLVGHSRIPNILHQHTKQALLGTGFTYLGST